MLLKNHMRLNMARRLLSLQTSRQIKGKRILLVDDLLATGGTVSASVDLIKQAGGIIAGTACLIELTGLGGRAILADKGCPVVSLQSYEF